jgi:type VI secretion system protein ImpH
VNADDPRGEPSPAQPLFESLRDEPHRHHFLQAVRRVEALHPERPRLGESKKVAEDPIRFRQPPSLRFAPRSLEGLHPSADGGPPALLVNFFGMFGPNGPLPHHLTEYALQRGVQAGDHTFARFMDVFHHRLTSLFYRAWAVHNQAVSHDRPEQDRFAVYVASLCGLGQSSLRNRDRVQDGAKLHYSGHLACRNRHADGLVAILREYCGVPVRLVPFVGHWVDIPEAYWCRLGGGPESCALGQSAIVGKRFFDRQQKFRIQVGPMGLDEYKRFLPGGISFQRVVDWVRNYVGDFLEWDLELMLTAVEVPLTQLGKAGQVGWTTWPLARAQEKKQGSLILRPDGSRRRESRSRRRDD